MKTNAVKNRPKRRFLRAIGWVFGTLTVLILGAFGYFTVAFPKAEPAPELNIERTPERVKRGEYLATNVAVCLDCHSKRDFSLYAGPPTPGTFGAGGERFGHDFGLPGEVYTKNLTPHGIGDWTDGELFRAITTGVGRDGHALFPVMPYGIYGKMDPEDIKDIIAYLRTLPAIKNDLPKRQLDFPLNFIVETIPGPAQPQKKPDTLDRVAYGKYLVTMASCGDCHTPTDKDHKPVPGRDLAGGVEFKFPQGTLRPANLTPDKTGLGQWTEAQFVQRFRVYADPAFEAPKMDPKGFNTIMPWLMYGKMKESDLKAIYAYLRSVKPVRNEVVKFTPAQNPQAIAEK
ncbi:MAG: c-type cytochrome [Sphingobacteriaceae bacterium]|nr:c-type cytochrome [Cytophagaceae bacterium]